MCLVRLFTPCSLPSGPRFSRVVVFVRSSSFVSGFRLMSRSILLVRVVFVSSSRRLSCVTVLWSPAMCFILVVGYDVKLRGFLRLLIPLLRVACFFLLSALVLSFFVVLSTWFCVFPLTFG